MKATPSPVWLGNWSRTNRLRDGAADPVVTRVRCASPAGGRQTPLSKSAHRGLS